MLGTAATVPCVRDRLAWHSRNAADFWRIQSGANKANSSLEIFQIVPTRDLSREGLEDRRAAENYIHAKLFSKIFTEV